MVNDDNDNDDEDDVGEMDMTNNDISKGLEDSSIISDVNINVTRPSTDKNKKKRKIDNINIIEIAWMKHIIY